VIFSFPLLELLYVKHVKLRSLHERDVSLRLFQVKSKDDMSCVI